ncbi:Uncharacterised protein [Legionella pneumophila]|nr:hypothetical protein A5478_03850 [Legionella pneumophila]MDC8031388.1 hypothetical protein [Legionella pneumophila subsp. pneumophila]ANH15159.1 hypothetical protein A5480_03845 [Legionella pneumophila]ANH18124.1 hypothetical protein A5479_03845 [Legionella pneumophila]APX19008.1 hypothetical protein A1D14_03845 [Legionella pneumophila]
MVWFFNMLPFLSLFFRQLYRIHVKYLNRATVARANPLNANLYIYKERSKGRIKKTLQGVKCQSGNSKKYAKGAKEPWIIITSLPKGLNTAKKIIKIYKLTSARHK